MRLYHYTRPEYLASIQKVGINRGDVPLTPFTGISMPWLTTDGDAGAQPWAGPPDSTKVAVRLTVEIDEADPNIMWWPAFAKMRGVADWWYETLDVTGGLRSECWYVYGGVIKPEWIVDVEIDRRVRLSSLV